MAPDHQDHAWEWHKDKDLANLAKHGKGFAEVPRLFEARYQFERIERRHGQEERFIVIGTLDGEPWRLVMAITKDGRRRPISFRRHWT